MAGDYPSADFEILEEGAIRRVVHLPTGLMLETVRTGVDPIAVSAAYRVEVRDDVNRSREIVQAALRHLRVWLMRRYGKASAHLATSE